MGRALSRVWGQGLGRIGVAAGLLGGLLASGCSFNLPARCDTTNCSTTDQGSVVDMAPAPPDPGVAGPYMVAMTAVTQSQQPPLKSGQLYLPSDNGTTLSTKLTTYPLVLLAPAQHMDPTLLGDYATRLASHGMVVALYQVMDETDQVSYRTVGLSLLSSLVGNSEPAVASHLDMAHVGLAGYELGAEMSVAMASQMMTMRGLALIDPQVVSGNSNSIDGLQEMAKVKLTGTQPVLFLGETISNTSMNGMIPCTNAPTNYQKFYDNAMAPALALQFTKAAHGEFTDDYPNPSCFGGTMAKADTKRLAIKYLTAYFQWTLLERASSKDYLTGASFTTDASQFMLVKSEK